MCLTEEKVIKNKNKKKTIKLFKGKQEFALELSGPSGLSGWWSKVSP